jgi:hypothetical protein
MKPAIPRRHCIDELRKLDGTERGQLGRHFHSDLNVWGLQPFHVDRPKARLPEHLE